MIGKTVMRGACLCGSIVFELPADRLRAYRCHCSLCRRHTGTHANLAAIVDADRFRWRAGAEHVRSWRKASGYRADFCGICGSPVPHTLESRPAYWVPGGLLDDDAQLEVVAEFHLDSRASWDRLPPEGQPYGGFPELDEFFALVHAR